MELDINNRERVEFKPDGLRCVESCTVGPWGQRVLGDEKGSRIDNPFRVLKGPRITDI